jgi:hypothetical protein
MQDLTPPRCDTVSTFVTGSLLRYAAAAASAISALNAVAAVVASRQQP